MAAVNLLLFGKQGGLNLMLLDDHGDFDVYSYTTQTRRPQTIAPLPWKSLYFVLREAITEWLYGWRSPTMTRDSCKEDPDSDARDTHEPSESRSRSDWRCPVDVSVDFCKHWPYSLALLSMPSRCRCQPKPHQLSHIASHFPLLPPLAMISA
jgi:hypothetical protein